MSRSFKAVFLSLLYPGLGQIYNGQLIKGFSFIIIQFFCIFIFRVTLVFFPYTVIILWIIGMIDAYKYSISNRKNKKRNSRLIFLYLIIGGLFAYIGGNYAWNQGGKIFDKPEKDKEIIKNQAKTYLEDKYNDNFFVKQINYEWNTKVYQMKIVSEKYPQLNFRVNVGEFSTDEIFDDYLDTVWSSQSREELEPFVIEAYSQKAIFKSYINAQQISSNFRGNIPEYKSARQIYKDEAISQLVLIYVFKEITDLNKEEEIKKIFKIINSYKGVNVKNSSLQIIFFAPELIQNKPLSIIEDNEFENFKVNFHNKINYTFTISSSEMRAIESEKEVERYLTKRE